MEFEHNGKSPYSPVEKKRQCRQQPFYPAKYSPYCMFDLAIYLNKCVLSRPSCGHHVVLNEDGWYRVSILSAFNRRRSCDSAFNQRIRNKK